MVTSAIGKTPENRDVLPFAGARLLSESNLVDPPGPRIGFLNQRPAHGAKLYPVGTIVVKAVQTTPKPQDWAIFALAKRGADFNPSGAVGWEYFLLKIGDDDVPRITSRGIAPSDDGRGDMGTIVPSTGYFSGGVIAPCNLCHGQSVHADTDFMISTELAPANTAQ